MAIAYPEDFWQGHALVPTGMRSRFMAAARAYERYVTTTSEEAVAWDRVDGLCDVDPVAACALIDTMSPSPQRDALHARAFAHQGQFEQADLHLTRASQWPTAKTPAARACIVAATATRFILSGDAVLAQRTLTGARSQTPEVQLLLATTQGAAGDPNQQARTLLGLISTLDTVHWQHAKHRARAVGQFAALAREIRLGDQLDALHEQLYDKPWPADQASTYWRALRDYAWALIWDGSDVFEAIGVWRYAASFASDPGRVLLLCDRAYLAKVTGELRWSQAEINEAREITSSINWQKIPQSEASGLLALAHVMTEVDRNAAVEYLDMYLETAAGPRPLYGGSDERQKAMEQYVRATIAVAFMQPNHALTLIASARRTFERLGYTRRVASCAAIEFRLTGDRCLVSTIETEIAACGASPFAEEFRSSLQPRALLSPRQRMVFDALCDGKTTYDIAAEFGRSPCTVRNQIVEILRTFGVKSRMQLLADVRRREFQDRIVPRVSPPTAGVKKKRPQRPTTSQGPTTKTSTKGRRGTGSNKAAER